MATKQFNINKHELVEAVVEVLESCLRNGDFIVSNLADELTIDNIHFKIHVDVDIVQSQLAEDYDIQASREEIIFVIKSIKIALTVPEK